MTNPMNPIFRFILSPINKRLYLVAKWAYLGTTAVYLFRAGSEFLEKNHNDATTFGLIALAHACLCVGFFILHARLAKTS